MVKQFFTAASFASLLLLSACSSLSTKPISAEDKDTTGQYDGLWILNEKALSARQQIGNSFFRCYFNDVTQSVFVTDGVATMRRGSKSYQSNVASNGRFRIEIPSDSKFTRSSGVNANKNGITYIYTGKLANDNGKGLLTLGMESLNNSGCSTRVSIKQG